MKVTAVMGLTYKVRGWYRLVEPGEIFEIKDADFQRLFSLGAVVEEGHDTHVAPAPAFVPEPAPAVEEPAPVKAPMVAKPAKAASLARWREYAQSLGIDHKGLSKAEIIAATR